jgi:hypothetical protein
VAISASQGSAESAHAAVSDTVTNSDGINASEGFRRSAVALSSFPPDSIQLPSSGSVAHSEIFARTDAIPDSSNGNASPKLVVSVLPNSEALLVSVAIGDSSFRVQTVSFSTSSTFLEWSVKKEQSEWRYESAGLVVSHLFSISGIIARSPASIAKSEEAKAEKSSSFVSSGWLWVVISICIVLVVAVVCVIYLLHRRKPVAIPEVDPAAEDLLQWLHGDAREAMASFDMECENPLSGSDEGRPTNDMSDSGGDDDLV